MAMNMIWDLECDDDYMDYVEIDLSDEIAMNGLIPGLPEEVALECLLRVNHTAFPQLQGVCKRWGELVTGQDFYEERKRVGATQNCICVVQALPEIKDSSGKHQSAPVFGLSVCDSLDLTWLRLPAMPEFPHGVPIFCRLVGVNGKLVLLGGLHPSSYEPLRNVYIYNFSSQAWKKCADMPCSRSFFACGALGNRIVVAGGHDENKNALASADIYSPEEDRWDALPDMSEERDECGGVVLDGNLAVISGYSTSSQGLFSASGEIYNPQTGRWSRVEGMWSEGVIPGPFVMSLGHLFAVQNQNLVRYWPEKNVWSVIDTLPAPQEGRIATCAAVMQDGLLLMTLPASGDPLNSLVHKRSLGVDGKWELVPCDEEFSGWSRAACGVEV